GRESIPGRVTAWGVIRGSDRHLAELALFCRSPERTGAPSAPVLGAMGWGSRGGSRKVQPGGDARFSTNKLFLCRRLVLRNGRRRGRRDRSRWLGLRLCRLHSRKYGRRPRSP